MESLNIEKKLAADLMAFLDDDDSGEALNLSSQVFKGDVTWVEFVKGMSSDQFQAQGMWHSSASCQVLFPQITLEALVAIPSSLRQNK